MNRMDHSPLFHANCFDKPFMPVAFLTSGFPSTRPSPSRCGETGQNRHFFSPVCVSAAPRFAAYGQRGVTGFWPLPWVSPRLQAGGGCNVPPASVKDQCVLCRSTPPERQPYTIFAALLSNRGSRKGCKGERDLRDERDIKDRRDKSAAIAARQSLGL